MTSKNYVVMELGGMVRFQGTQEECEDYVAEHRDLLPFATGEYYLGEETEVMKRFACAQHGRGFHDREKDLECPLCRLNLERDHRAGRHYFNEEWCDLCERGVSDDFWFSAHGDNEVLNVPKDLDPKEATGILRRYFAGAQSLADRSELTVQIVSTESITASGFGDREIVVRMVVGEDESVRYRRGWMNQTLQARAAVALLETTLHITQGGAVRDGGTFSPRGEIKVFSKERSGEFSVFHMRRVEIEPIWRRVILQLALAGLGFYSPGLSFREDSEESEVTTPE